MEAGHEDRAGSQVRNRWFSNASPGIGNASVNEDQLLALSPVRSCVLHTLPGGNSRFSSTASSFAFRHTGDQRPVRNGA